MAGFKGRKRRLKNFSRRAKAFERAIGNGTGYRELERDGVVLKVGVGNHRRLVRKGTTRHFFETQQIIRALGEKFLELEKNPETKAEHFYLAGLKSSPAHLVQEYVDKPNIPELLAFLRARKTGIKKRLTQSEWLRCKRFTAQNRIGFEELRLAAEELEAFYEKEKGDAWFGLGLKNVVVLGQKREKNGRTRIRLAIVDL